MRFAVVNLGCKVNRVESDTAAARLSAAGWSAAPEAEADLVVVNTCAVTGEAEKKTRKAVRHALRESPAETVLVTGCAAALDAAVFEAMDPRVRVVGKAELADVLDELADAPSAKPAFAPLPTGSQFRTRVGVKVQDGCDNACTYCIVHVARGRATSRPADEVVRECAALAREGVREVVLTGINLGSYRHDGARLPDLLERLLGETDGLGPQDAPSCRFRISSIEPCDVSQRLMELLACAEGRVCRHLHLPLQSGSSKVLREMARPYDAAAYGELVRRLRRQVPEISLSTDIIVGFPGETEADFTETLALARSCGFSKIHVFPYSMREGTPASARADQVPASVKAARAAKLRALAAELRRADRARRAGATELALVEDAGRATTESYHQVDAPAGASPGDLVPLRL